jgi:hypothetical protein
MAKYSANPVIVDAFKIVKVAEAPNYEQRMSGDTALTLDNGEKVIATVLMTARYDPVEGDYWVVQSDGYIYLNPKEVFERKYSPLAD